MQFTADRPADAVRRSRPIYRVFVSSTWLDLQPERTALMNALHRMEEMRFVGMEFFGNRPDDTHAASLDQVEACEVFVGVIGFRYGSGITEAEYRRARQLGLPCFLYFKDQASFRPELTDGDAALAAKLDAFKAELMREHTVKSFPSPAELAANATADLHNWVAARWVTSEPVQAAPTRERRAAPTADRTSALRLIERIEHDWIEGVLEASLHHRARLELGLNWNADAVEHPWERIVLTPNRPIQSLRQKDTVGGLFDAAQNTLLVLGEPGAGKTTSLLELARELVGRARNSPEEPVPVVLALSTWTAAHHDFGAWLLAELALRYQVPKRLARGWVDDGRFVLLLDGLDEVPAEAREACVAAINAFQETHPPSGLAVTCRVAEYEALPRKLRLRAAICLQPLSAEQVDRYLAAAGPQLASLAQALRDDTALREMARTPLLLTVMTMAWRDAATVKVGASDSPEERRREIFEAYVQAMVRRPSKAIAAFPPEQTVNWLAWLARGMKAHGYTLFALEQLQPSWLRSGMQATLYFLATRLMWTLGLAGVWLAITWTRMHFGLQATRPHPELWPMTLLVFATAVLLGSVVGGTDAFAARLPSRRPGRRLGMMLGAIIIVGNVARLVVTRVYGENSVTTVAAMAAIVTPLAMFALAFCASVDVQTHDIEPPDTLRWTWRAAFDRFQVAAIANSVIIAIGFVGFASVAIARKGVAEGLHHVGVNGGMVAGGLAGAMVGIFLSWWKRLGWKPERVATALVFPVAGALVGAWFGPAAETARMATFFGVVVAVLVGLGGGFVSGVMDPARAQRTGFWFWFRVPVLAAIAVGLLVGGPLAAANYVYARTYPRANVSEFIVQTSLFTVFTMVIAFVRFGGVAGPQHFFLRWLLVRRGELPRRAEAFLGHAAQLALLQRVGFGYRFVHALLVEHLAAREASIRNR